MCLHNLAERPERDAVAVGEAPALSPVDELGPVVDPDAELAQQASLAHARLTRDGDELDLRLADHALECVLQQAQLPVAADERRRRRRFRVDSKRLVADRARQAGTGSPLPLSSSAGISSYVITWRVARYVCFDHQDASKEPRTAGAPRC